MGLPPGQMHTMLAFGAELEDLVESSVEEGRCRLLDLTSESSTNLQRSERPVSGRVA